ncbi:MAG: hypothetical protein ACYC2O_07690 [Microthrixaceae bacterium]
MGHDNSPEALVAEATQVIGPEATVLAAGVFGLQNLLLPQMAGNMAGGVAGSTAGLGVTGDAVGTMLGGLAAKKAAAEAQGVTVQLLLAVTEHHFVVLNRDTGGRLPDVVASFDRGTAQVQISKLGLSRIITLTEPASGEALTLHGSTGPFSSFSKGDAVVLHLLAA